MSGFTYEGRRAALATDERAYARFMGVLALCALAIAAAGGFATVAQAVSGEIKSSAIRLGLGATRQRALLASASAPLGWLAAGSAAGIVIGVAAGQMLQSAIRNVQGPELTAVAGCLGVSAAVLAGSLAAPARLLRSLNVATLLREER